MSVDDRGIHSPRNNEITASEDAVQLLIQSRVRRTGLRSTLILSHAQTMRKTVLSRKILSKKKKKQTLVRGNASLRMIEDSMLSLFAPPGQPCYIMVSMKWDRTF